MVNCSQGLVLATTAMVVSTTVIVLAYSRQKSYQEQESSSRDQPLRSCLCSSDEGRRREKRQKKRVRFAEDVKDPLKRVSRTNDVVRRGGDGVELQSQRKRGRDGCRTSYRDEFEFEFEFGFDHGRGTMMPANRVALYSYILRDRVNRITCSY